MTAAGAATLEAMTPDGRYVAFFSPPSNLVANDANGALVDVFVRDRKKVVTRIVSRAADGGLAEGAYANLGVTPDGAWVAFDSTSQDYLVTDANGAKEDVFRVRGK